MSRALFLCLVFYYSANLRACQSDPTYGDYGQLHIVQLASSPFPHPRRADGHTFDKKLYPAAEHYRDSSVAIFVPKGFRPSDSVNIIVHLHGWWNNIRTTLSGYTLPQQVYESGKNVLLVVPEGPRNAPDSFGGKLEDPGGLKNFVDELISVLVQKAVITKPNVCTVILSGHSGGYHAISFALMRGGMTEKVREVYLFDALYGQTEKIAWWIDHFQGKMISIYTDSGGTKWETEGLMEDLDGWGIPYFRSDESEITPADLSRHRLVFIHTDLGHDMVIHTRGQLRAYLKASNLPDR